MKRIDLVAFRKTLVTPDVAEAIRHMEMRVAAIEGARLIVQGPAAQEFTWLSLRANTSPTGCPFYASMKNTGRELRIRLQLPEGKETAEVRRRVEVETLWGIAVPCGFTPWTRYPIPGPCDDVFHYFGCWQPLYDSLLGEGRGELAWPSMAAAAQADVGKWEGEKAVERFVQAQLHRLGVPCGAVDGNVGDRTVAGLRALGVTGMPLERAASYLANMETPGTKPEERRRGFLSLTGPSTVVATGKIAVMKTPQGYTLAVDGPGRVIIDVGD